MNRILRNGTVFLLSYALTAAQFSTVFADNNASENQTESSMQEDMAQTPSKEAFSDDVRKGSGEMNGQRPEGQPPEMPDGEKPDGQPPEMSNGDNPPEKPDGEKPDGPG